MEPATVREQIEPLLHDAGVQAAYLFGSQQAGTAGPSSDVDIAVLVGRPWGLLDEQRLASRLQSVLHVPVDVVVLDRASLELRGTSSPRRVGGHRRTSATNRHDARTTDG